MDLEVFPCSQNQYSYLSFQTFKGNLRMLQITFCPQVLQEKSLKWPWSLNCLGSWNFWNFLFSTRISNGEYFKDFKIFDLTWIWWIWLERPNYFMLAKKCRHESCVINFLSAKMEFASAIFKKLYFSKYPIKRCYKQITSIQKLVWPYK